MTIKRWVLFVLLIGSNLYSWGQWSEITTENTRISSDASTAYNSTLYGVTPDGTGGFIMAWVEREGNAAAMYVQRYDANANTQYINAAGKRGRLAFSVNGLSDPNCADGIKSVGLFRADGSNQAIIVYRVVKSSNAELYQQVINISDGAPQILANSGIGHQLALYTGGDLEWSASFVPNGGRLAVVSTYRTSGGTSDIKLTLINLSSPTAAPTEVVSEVEAGDQSKPRVFGAAWGSGVVVFVAHSDNNRQLHVKRYTLSGSTLTRTHTGRIDNAADIEQIIHIQNAIVQPATDEMVVYARNGGQVGVGTDVRAHRFRHSNATLIGVTNIFKSSALNNVNVAGGISGLTCFLYLNQSDNAQVMRIFDGVTSLSNELEVITRGYNSGGSSITGLLIEDVYLGNKKYFMTGIFNNKIYGQLINVSNTYQVSRSWADPGREICGVNDSKSRGNLKLSYSLGSVNPYLAMWEDERNATGQCRGDVYAQTFDINGNLPAIIQKPTIAANVCLGASVPINFVWRTQVFSSTFSALVLNEAGTTLVRTLAPSGTTTPLNVTIPRDLPVGRYKIQINGVPAPSSVTFPYKSPISDVFTVNALPTIRASAIPAATYSVGDTIKLQSSGATTYEWSGPVSYTSTQQNPTRPNATVAMSGKYTVKGTNATTGCSDTSSVTVTVAPVVVTISKPTLNRTSLCLKDTLRMSFTTTGTFNAANVFSVDVMNQAGTSVVLANVATSPTSPIVYIIPVSLPTGSYRVRIKSSNPAATNVANSDVFTVTSTPTIAATANGTKPLSVCAGVAVALSATDGFATYSWSGPSFTNTTRSPQLTTPVSGIYVVTGTSTCGTARDTVKVTVNSIPVPNAASSKSTYIVGETIQLTSGSGTGYTYAWTGPNGYTSTQQNPSIANGTAAMSGNYEVTITANGCTAKGTVSISVTTQPVTGIDNVSATSASACPGTGVDVNFTIIPSNGVGTFNVFLIDANNQKIGTSLGSGTRSPIRATIPASAAAGTNYRLLVETSATVNKSSTAAFSILQRATAQMLSPRNDTSIVARKTGDNLAARVRIQGSGPFTLTFSAGTRNVRNAGDTTLTFRFDNDGTFSFQGISGVCGVGSLGGTQNLRITLKRVVAVEEDTLAKSVVSVFPNPTSYWLTIQIKNGKAGQTTQLRLYDVKGSLLKTQSFYNLQHQWEMGDFPAGNYWLEVVQGDKKQSFRIVKE
ncbi:T9SS type A sorting domain-containing protein [Runella sp.]|uniref:T9SS type A sorting domain-containing protein n=1 Tax=Runella sp. TaxID=1960881 RepID=UPI0026359CCB|nr:T9SS type A sorting domain-containing protein [Runella sp.]